MENKQCLKPPTRYSIETCPTWSCFHLPSSPRKPGLARLQELQLPCAERAHVFRKAGPTRGKNVFFSQILQIPNEFAAQKCWCWRVWHSACFANGNLKPQTTIICGLNWPFGLGRSLQIVPIDHIDLMVFTPSRTIYWTAYLKAVSFKCVHHLAHMIYDPFRLIAKIARWF